VERAFPDVAGVEHRYVDAGGLRVHVAEAGQGDPLVCVHGWPQHWGAWAKLIPELSKHYRVICPDLRGFGWTDAGDADGRKETLATDLVNLLDALELDKVRLVGHDWGAFVSQLAALHAPARIERLAVMSILHPWFKRPKSPAALARVAYQFVIIAPVLGKQVVQRTGFINTILTKAAIHPLDPAARESYAAQFREPVRADATVALYRAFTLKELSAIDGGAYASKRLVMPTLVMYGENDRVISAETFAGMGEHCDDLRVVPIADCGHFPGEEQTDAVLAQLLPFLEGA
jgi:pimeloyl-ACP methyl ester carboxylesterase